MDENTQKAASPALEGVNPDRLFLASRISLISTSVTFGVMSAALPELRAAFDLTAAQGGAIVGATLGLGFAIAIVVFGALVEELGMGRLMRVALVCHIVGPLMMIFATGYWMLYIGGLIIAMGNGTVQAVGNPLTVNLFPDKIAEKLNKFHMWFPGGIALGAVLSFIMTSMNMGWQIKIALILIPTIAYGILFTGQKFPVSERVQSGVTFGQMCKETFLRPLFWVLFITMGMTATMELGPGSWMGSVMENAMAFAGVGAGILVLAYGNLIVALLRYFLAGPLLRIMTPICILALSSIIGGLGLFWLTYVSSPFMIIVAATVFYVGICYFWPTMIGVGAERIPKGGSLVLALLNGGGMLVVGQIGAPVMGQINDAYTTNYLDDNRAAVIEVLEAAPTGLAGDVLAMVSDDDPLPPEVAVALQAIRDTSDDEALRDRARALINPAETYGGLWSFRWVAALGIVLVIIFGAIYFQDKARGGPKAEPA